MINRKKSPTPGPIIAIVGRTNVGKSTLFNRLIEEAKALVSPVAGTTRDRNYGVCSWRGESLVFVDTGGLDVERRNRIEQEVLRQAKLAIKEAQLILFVVDLSFGLLPQDRELAAELKKGDKPVILVGNKADNPKIRFLAHEPEWRGLTLGEPFAVSAENGSGVGDLLDLILQTLPQARSATNPFTRIAPIKIAIIGKPNVGKSSLVNSLLGEERVIVSDIPHTTREPQDTLLLYGDKPFVVIDTAGIRKRARIEHGLEKMGVKKSLNAAKRADVVVLVLDASEPVGIQDKHLAGIALETHKPFIIVINKWDLIPEKTTKTMAGAENNFRAFFPFLDWAPVIFTSAKSGERVPRILELAEEVKRAYGTAIPPSELDAFIRNLTHAPRGVKPKGVRHPRILAIRQRAKEPPVFEIAVRGREPLPDAYLKFLERRLREKFNFVGTPVIVKSKSIRL